MLDKNKILNAKIMPFTDDQENYLLKAVSKLEFGLIDYDLKSNTVFLNTFLIDIFKVSNNSELSFKEMFLRMIDSESFNDLLHFLTSFNVEKVIDFTCNTLTKNQVLVFKMSYDDINQRAILIVKIKVSENEERLKKILKANELIIEIKDIVDNVSDLNEMFEYLLSKIHTVIPAANRSCILRIDEDDKLFLDSKFNYTEEYVDSFDLLFKDSFAYMHMADDYSKSVIIDDIQKKYSNLFPDIKGDLIGINLQSNVTTPLVVNGVLYGIISVDSEKNRVFDDVDLHLLDFMKIQIERAIEKYNKYETIKRNSNLDPMTGIANRRNLKDMFVQLLNISRIEKSSFLFVVFDIDKLKYINDNYGHITGDKVIKQFAFVIQKQIRESDFLARIGGDEFVGVFLNVEEDVLVERITRWKTHFDNHPNTFKGLDVTAQFSYGISKYPSDGHSFDELLEIADKKMYLQKRGK